ncbi:hypothetical protein KJ853_01435 [Patescibacteria group bacterium]|nr:hypothetical protein [Patescibacteria group bacterium]
MAIIPGEDRAAGVATISPSQQKQKKLIYVFLLVVLITAGFYLLYVKTPDWFSSPAVPVSSDPNEQLNSRLVELLKPISLNISFLNDKRFQALVLPGNLPISPPAQKGRPNPFEPF